MHVMILGAAGMLGQKLARAVDAGAIPGASHLTLVDRVQPQPVPGLPCVCEAVDLETPDVVEALVERDPDLVFHLAAVVSGQAEAEFETGYAVNLDLTRRLLEAIRLRALVPRLVFSSSLAVYGPPFPDIVPEDFVLRPASSYGVQKAMCELLVSDYTRKGFVHGTSVRLPTVSIRPGAPNAAASGFLSGILREPLGGKGAELPVDENTRVWIASPDVSVQGLAHAGAVEWTRISAYPVLNLRGISVSVSEMLDALEAEAGPAARARVQRVDHPEVARIVQSWPQAFETKAAEELGFPVNASIADIVHEYVSQFGKTI
ncbi:MAG: NAD-dependent epimerase/dehydratase family protein [Dinoroseobacter sp.]|nr:NAD-dependent epimerase/dehydratase family protein [Dinoroseobacter sp.]